MILRSLALILVKRFKPNILNAYNELIFVILTK